MVFKKLIPLVGLLLALGACTSEEMFQNEYIEEAKVTDRTRAGIILEDLPPAEQKIAVSLYDFQDSTGQFKFNGNYSDFSSAVTKGGLSILTKALLDAGHRNWFTVTERSGLKNLLQERQIINVMRGEYKSVNGQQVPTLPPLIYGGMLLEGGIIGYDSNVITGGAGAIYLGIGGNTQYARDVITVYLRAVNIKTGEVMLSVTSSKTIFSTSLQSNVLKYITFDRLLQAEAGFSLNEPVMLATRQAIETAVYSMIMEGAIEGLWSFKDPQAGHQAMGQYIARRESQNILPSTNEQQIFERAMHNNEQEIAKRDRFRNEMQNMAMGNTQRAAPVQPVNAPAPAPERDAAPVNMARPANPVQQQNAVVSSAPSAKRKVKYVWNKSPDEVINASRNYNPNARAQPQQVVRAAAPQVNQPLSVPPMLNETPSSPVQAYVTPQYVDKAPVTQAGATQSSIRGWSSSPADTVIPKRRSKPHPAAKMTPPQTVEVSSSQAAEPSVNTAPQAASTTSSKRYAAAPNTAKKAPARSRFEENLYHLVY